MALSTAVERFLRYVSINTTANPQSRRMPTNPQQFVLAQMLSKELEQMGAEHVVLSNDAMLSAQVPPSVGCENRPGIGFLAHLDTVPCQQTGSINAGIVHQYDGGEILLDEASGQVLSAAHFPRLLQYVSDDLIVTDGKSPLGADAKAGIAAVMDMVEHFCRCPADPHARIFVVFVPDVTIGRGVERVRRDTFAAQYAYSIAGGPVGELGFNTFNAAAAAMDFQGVNSLPGEAYGTMRNALQMAEKFLAMLPQDESAENTRDFEGFYLPVFLQGTIAAAHLELLIRDHDDEIFQKRKAHIRRWAAGFGPFARLTLAEQYPNMSSCLDAHPFVKELARTACKDCAVPFYEPAIRRPAAGAWLSAVDLPCPDLFTGAENLHGPFEFLPVSGFEKAVRVVRRLAQLSAQESLK